MGVLTCVVIASDAGIRSVIEASLEPLGLHVKGLSSPGDLMGIVRDVPIGGILLELMTSIQSSPEEKEASNEFARVYPFARFRLVGHDVRILGEGNTLEAFAQRCRNFNPRILRRDIRISRNLAVYLSRDPGFEDSEKAVTINVSKGGCFVYTSRDWRIGDYVWLRLPGEEITIVATVCFWCAWGQKGTPGIGIRFNVESPLAASNSHF
jgi:hypothetical protein